MFLTKNNNVLFVICNLFHNFAIEKKILKNNLF